MTWDNEEKDDIQKFLDTMEDYPPVPGGMKPYNFDTLLLKAVIQLCQERE